MESQIQQSTPAASKGSAETGQNMAQSAQELLDSLRAQAASGQFVQPDDSVYFAQSLPLRMRGRAGDPDTPEIRALILRQLIERAIIRQAVQSILAAADGAYTISVFDGEAYPVKRSRDLRAIMDEIMACDEETLIVRNSVDASKVGSIFLVYGNDGWDVIADHTASECISGLLAEADRLAYLISCLTHEQI